MTCMMLLMSEMARAYRPRSHFETALQWQMVARCNIAWCLSSVMIGTHISFHSVVLNKKRQRTACELLTTVLCDKAQDSHATAVHTSLAFTCIVWQAVLYS